MTRLPALTSRRKRENSLQEDRGSFVTTPTAELSSQEEALLGSFLDWSLDHCSGYEGDQESEGEKEGDGERRGHVPHGDSGQEGGLRKGSGRRERAGPWDTATGRSGCGLPPVPRRLGLRRRRGLPRAPGGQFAV